MITDENAGPERHASGMWSEANDTSAPVLQINNPSSHAQTHHDTVEV